MECVSICRGLRKVAGLAVMHQGGCLCLSSEKLEAISTHRGYRFLQQWSCLSMSDLQSRQDLYYAFNVSYGFCEQLDIIQHGQWDTNMTWFGSIVTLTCDKDYVINGSAALQCVGQTGRSTYFPVWNSSVPSCEAVDSNKSTCGHPGNVTHGKWDSNNTLLGSMVTLGCDDGFALNGSATLLCMQSSDMPDDGRTTTSLVWNASTPYCQAVEQSARDIPSFPDNESKCDPPGNVSHGKWDSNTTMNGRTVFTLHCDDGYILNGSATLLCIDPSNNGLPANSSVPSCQPVEVQGNTPKCGHLGDVSHGKWALNTTRLGSIVTLDCDEGYVIGGSATLQCVASSNDNTSTHQPVWNASIPICQAVEHTVPHLLVPLTASILIFISLLFLITAWCLYRRKRYKPPSHPDQADNDVAPGPGSRANNVAFQLYTLIPSVSHTASSEGYPVPVRAENSAIDQDHVYQDADEVRRKVTETQRISVSNVLVEGSWNHGSSTEQLPFTCEQPLGAECQLGTSHLMPSSGDEEYEQLQFPFTVTSGQGTAIKQVRLFDTTEYNSLESTKGPTIGHATDFSSAFDSDDYSQLNLPQHSVRRGYVYKSDESADEMAPNCAASPRTCTQLYARVQNKRGVLSDKNGSTEAHQSTTEELYAKVDKTGDKFSKKDSSVSARRLEELYAKVDKQVNGPSKENSSVGGQGQTPLTINGAETTPVDLYVNVEMKGGNFLQEASSVSSCMLDELYAKVDKHRDGHSKENGSIGREAETTKDGNTADTASVELYVNVDKRDGGFQKEDSSLFARGCEELYTTVNKQRERPANGNGSSDGHQGTAEEETVSESAALELYATVD
ncbi:uncharacterized protein [Diadema antillarum]|uniref:uncharacterized protein isoform X2 n=1 Tax=Diadema antillarum TaxID=105358 RepID=UPI003A8B3962